MFIVNFYSLSSQSKNNKKPKNTMDWDSIYLAEWQTSILADDTAHPALLGIQDRSVDMYNCLSGELIELIVNICDELSFSSEVEFTCLDNFAVYSRQQYSQMLAQLTGGGSGSDTVAHHGSECVGQSQPGAAVAASTDKCTSRNTSTEAAAATTGSVVSSGSATDRSLADAWLTLVERFAHAAPVRLVAVLMLSAKMIDNRPMQSIRLRPIVAMLRSLRPQLTIDDLKAAETEVFHALAFTIKPSLTYRSLDLLLGHSEQYIKQATSLYNSGAGGGSAAAAAAAALMMPCVRSKALIIQRIVYIMRPRIYAQLKDGAVMPLDWAVLGDLMTERQRHICLTAAVVTCAFAFAEHSAAGCARLARHLARVAGVPERQLMRMGEVIAQMV